jgi:hypothetical protein
MSLYPLQAFFARFPSSYGALTFSRVAFNRDLTEAFFYTEHLCGLCGEGKFVYMRKTGGSGLSLTPPRLGFHDAVPKCRLLFPALESLLAVVELICRSSPARVKEVLAHAGNLGRGAPPRGIVAARLDFRLLQGGSNHAGRE